MCRSHDDQLVAPVPLPQRLAAGESAPTATFATERRRQHERELISARMQPAMHEWPTKSLCVRPRRYWAALALSIHREQRVYPAAFLLPPVGWMCSPPRWQWLKNFARRSRVASLGAGSRVMQVKFYRVYEKQSIWQQKRQRIAKALDQRHHMLKYPSCHRLCGRTKVVLLRGREVQRNTPPPTFVYVY